MVVVRRVRESGSGDRIDRVVGSLFGLAGKIPPEKFSGGGGWWPAAGSSPEKKGGRESFNASEDASKQGRIHDAYATVTKEQKVDDDKETAQEVRKCLDTSS
ncbi:hypothetical protein Tco_1391723 [Tanacetum coccineum]